VIGVATTYWLARRGVDVLLLEGRRIGWGATGRNAGLMLAAATVLEDIQSTRDVLREEAIDAEFEEPGHLALAITPAIWEKMHDEVARRHANAPTLRVLGRTECQDLVGRRISPRVIGGRWLPGAGAIHPVRFVWELALRAQRRGASLAYPVRVRRLTRVNARHEVRVETSRGVVGAHRVLVACAALTPRVIDPARRILRTHRAAMCSTEVMPPVFHIGLAIDWGAFFWRQSSDGAVILGGGRTQSDLSALLPNLFPGFPRFAIERRWEGVMDETSDGRPIVGKWPRERAIWVAAGFGGHGLPPALGVGAALAESIAVDRPSSRLTALDPARFSEVLHVD
jgi:sarcosine oxidase subunit beta